MLDRNLLIKGEKGTEEKLRHSPAGGVGHCRFLERV